MLQVLIALLIAMDSSDVGEAPELKLPRSASPSDPIRGTEGGLQFVNNFLDA